MKIDKRKAETVEWLADGMTDEQLEIERVRAIIGAEIYLIRTSKQMDQKEFAKFMGVSQGMVSRWESGTYNFSVATLAEICSKLGYTFEPQIVEKKPHAEENTPVVYYPGKNDFAPCVWNIHGRKDKYNDAREVGFAS